MSTHAHIVYENENGQFLMRWHMNDSYIMTRYLYPGLGQILLEIFNQEKKVKQLFDLNRDFSSIVSTEENYKQDVIKNIKDNGLKKHEKQEKLFFDQVLFMNGQAIKTKKPSDTLDDKVENRVYDTLQNCLHVCEEYYVYLYKQNDKNWYIKIAEQFILLKHAAHIVKQYEKICLIYEEIGLDENKTRLLEFKISKSCFQLLGLVSNYDLHEADNVCNYEKFLDNQTRTTFEINKIKDYSKKYELYLLHKKLNKIVENKPNETKKLKI